MGSCFVSGIAAKHIHSYQKTRETGMKLIDRSVFRLKSPSLRHVSTQPRLKPSSHTPEAIFKSSGRRSPIYIPYTTSMQTAYACGSRLEKHYPQTYPYEVVKSDLSKRMIRNSGSCTCRRKAKQKEERAAEWASQPTCAVQFTCRKSNLSQLQGRIINERV